MYRVTQVSGKWYAIQIRDVYEDQENIETFVQEGTPVILCQDLSDLGDLGIDVDEVEIVEAD